jgi:hypothetical protein
MSAERTCVTCSDAAAPMRVVEIDGGRAIAVCANAEGGREEVDVGVVDPVDVGDTLLVHAGTALAREPGDRRGPAGAEPGRAEMGP